MSSIMSKVLSRLIWLDRKRKGLVPEMGEKQIAERGHRAYVGSKWDILGPLQFEFLKSRGLLPHHTLYDVACGSLRAGIHFIPYLDKGNYCGIDREKALIDAGINEELSHEVFLEKAPSFVVSSSFEFEKFNKQPDYAIAQSLFTHLTLKDIRSCLKKLLLVAKPSCQFFATFDEEGVTPKSKQRMSLPNPPWSHSNLTLYFSREEMKKCAEKTGWKFEYIGDWSHPSNQRMVVFFL